MNRPLDNHRTVCDHSRAETDCRSITTTAPIILEECNDHVISELWNVLSEDFSASWIRDIGDLRTVCGSFEDLVRVWSEALDRASSNPEQRADALGLKQRLEDHATEFKKHRRTYSTATPEVFRHRYWPTGLHEFSNIEDRYSMSFCPRRIPLIRPATKVASAGSCFAHEIGRALRRWGYNYFITEPGPPHLTEEQREQLFYNRFSARYGIIFNVPSIRQLVERGLGLVKLKPYLWFQDGEWYDPYREKIRYKSPQEYAADLPVFEKALRRTLLETEVFILTLGVNEVWYFKNDGSYLSRVPWRLCPTLLGRKVLSVEENVHHLQRMVDVWQSCNPNIKFIVTVSPVPLLATFQSEEYNVIVANSHSKSVLRVAAQEFAERNDNVFYFPAYELVLWGSRQPFKEDGRHVHPDAIERVMQQFTETFVDKS